MSVPQLSFDGVWKRFRRGNFHDSLRDLIPAVTKALFTGRPAEDDVGREEFWALQDVSFTVRENQVLGIIGHNGAGKSTVLKILPGILTPTRGRYTATGRVGALIEIAAGFHGDLTGRENMFLQGAIMGMPPELLRARFDEIVEFAGLAEFIDTPVKRYSTGMRARLGFSLAAHLDPEILIVDEVLAVGDQAFQEKAYAAISGLVTSGIPVVLVSHQLNRIQELATEVIVLDHGQVIDRGDPQKCVDEYLRVASEKASQLHASIVGEVEPVPVTIRAMTPLDGDRVASGSVLRLRIEGRRDGDVPADMEPIAVLVANTGGLGVISIAKSRDFGVDLPRDADFEVDVALEMNVTPGTYLVQPVVWSGRTKRPVHSGPATFVQVTPGPACHGLVQMNAEMRLLSNVGSK